MVIKATELEVQNILFGKLEDSSLVASQKMAFISYKEQGSKLIAQTPDFITEAYGIPREGTFYSTAKSRAFYKLPFCHERHQYSDELDYGQIERFYDKLREIDKYLDTEEFRVQLFGEKNAKRYEYQPLVRVAQPAEEEEEEAGRSASERVYYRPPYTKVKLDLAYDTEEPRFRLFDKSTGERKEVALKTFDDILQHMRYLTKHRMAIHFSKLYAMKTASGNEKRKYGIILKAFAVECSNKSKPQLDKEIDLFSD